MNSLFRKTFGKLKERKVFRTLFIYLGGAWLALQVVDLFIGLYDLSRYFFDLALIFIIAGIPGSVIIAWFHGETGTQKVRKIEIVLHSILLFSAFVAAFFAFQFHDFESEIVIEHTENTIAVLPFQNMSGDSEDDYFSDGVTDDIITQLSKIEGMQVISRFSVMKYKNTDLSLREIGNDLNVNVILQGSIRRINDQVRISAQLINVENEENIWAEQYDRQMKEVFAVQSDVAQSIARSLSVELSPKEVSRIKSQPTANLDAYDFYLKGRDYYYLYRRADNEIAIEQFKRAIELDPGYAQAYAGLGDAYAQRVLRFFWPDNWLDSTILMGKKAIELDPELAEGYKALALGYSYKGWISKAIESDLAAIERNPNFFPAISNLGVEYGRKGLLDKQIPLLEKTITLVPLYPIPYVELAEVYANLGVDEKAFEFIEEAIFMQPDFTESYFALSRIYLRRGEFSKAYDITVKGLEITPNDPGLMAKMGQIELFRGKLDNAEAYLEAVYDLNLGVASLMDPISLSPSYLGYVYKKTGKPSVAEALFQQIEKTIKQAINDGNEYYKCKVEIGRLYAIQDQKVEALLWLNYAFEDGWFDYRMAELDPTFDNLRTEDDFKMLIRHMKKRVFDMQKSALN